MTIQSQDQRITAHDFIKGKHQIPLINEKEPKAGRIGILIQALQNIGHKARARRILKRAFSRRTGTMPANQEQYAVSAIVRNDGVLEIWLMSRDWKTITITSRYRRVHMIHDNFGRIEAAIPARNLAATVARISRGSGLVCS